MFKVIGDRFTGIVCGPCDNPASVFRPPAIGIAMIAIFLTLTIGSMVFARRNLR